MLNFLYIWWNVLIFTFTLFCVYYLYIKLYVYRYWERKNVEYVVPSFPFGSMKDALFLRRTLTNVINDVYNQNKNDYTGFFMMSQPSLLVRSRDLIEQIMCKDFECFVDRLDYIKTKDRFSSNLFSLTGDEWKCVRRKMEPVFTCENLPKLSCIVNDISLTLQGYVGSIADKETENVIDVYSLCSRYFTDVINTTAFGIEVDTIRDPSSYVYTINKLMTKPHTNIYMNYLLMYMAPNIISFFGLKLIHEDVHEFLIEVVKKSLNHREKKKISRQDYMEILLEMMRVNCNSKFTRRCRRKKLTIEECAAQIFLIFCAGCEKSAPIVTFCLYELAKKPELMRKAQNDIDNALNKHNWKWSYDILCDMPYLKQCIMETLRKYPPLGYVPRVCTTKFKIPKSDLVLEKGCHVMISINGIHHDPDRYPNPSIFDPSRFTPEEIAKRPKCDYLPYGVGSRSCFGEDLGHYLISMALAVLLAKFDFEVFSPINPDFIYDRERIVLLPEDPIKLKVFRRVFSN